MGVCVLKMAAKWEAAWQHLLSLCRRRGFIAAQQLEEGWTPTKNGYLTLGSALKRNITKEWHYNMVTLRQEIHLLEGTILQTHQPTHPSPGTPPLPHYCTSPAQSLMMAAGRGPVLETKDSREFRAVQCLLTGAQLPPEATFPLPANIAVDGKLALEAPTVEDGKAWASKIREELAPGAKVYRRQKRLLLHVKELTDTHLTLKGKNDNDSVTVPHCGMLCLTSGSPFLVKEDPTPAPPTAAPPTPAPSTMPGLSPSGSADCATPQPSSSPLPKEGVGQFEGDKGYPLFTVSNMSTLQQGLTSGAATTLRDDLTQTLVDRAQDIQEVLSLSLPFGLATVGPVFRALHPPHSDWCGIRMQEFDQLGVAYFCHADESHKMYLYWQKQRLRWWKQYAEHPDWFVLSERPSEELPAGATNASTIKFNFPWGVDVVESMVCHSPSRDGTTWMNMSAGLDRGFWAYLWDAMWCREGSSAVEEADKALRMNVMLSPFKVAVVPEDTTNSHQLMFAKQLSLELRHLDIATRLNERGSVEERYRCEDESGTPYAVTVDDNTLNCGLLQFRHRNSSLVEYIHKDDLVQTLQAHSRKYRFFKDS